MVTENIGAGVRLTGRKAASFLLQPVFVPESPLASFRVMRNVTYKEKMYTLNKPGFILQANTGCGWNASGSMTLEPKDIHVGRMKVNIEQCTEEFLGSVLEDTVLGSELDIEKLDSRPDGQKILSGIRKHISDAITDNIYRLAWLNGYDNEGGIATPSQYSDTLKSAADNHVLRGILQLADYYEGLPNGTTKLSTTYSGSTLTTTEVIALLQGLYEGQPIELRNIPDRLKTFKVTTEVYYRYQEYLEDFGTEQANRIVVNGVPVLSYRGIMLERHDIVDQELSNVSQFNITDPIWAGLTVQGNMVLATDILSNENQFRVWFDEQDELWKYKAKFKIGMGIAHPELLVYAK